MSRASVTKNRISPGIKALPMNDDMTNSSAPSFAPANTVKRTASTFESGKVSMAQGMALEYTAKKNRPRQAPIPFIGAGFFSELKTPTLFLPPDAK